MFCDNLINTLIRKKLSKVIDFYERFFFAFVIVVMVAINNKKNKVVPSPQKRVKKETDEDKVVRILKGDFENKFGMTYEKFIEMYNEILKKNPEKLI